MENQFLLDLLLKDLGKEDILGQSQHYAGVAFDVGQTLSNTQRTAIRNTARNSGAWNYIEPASLTPTWVHFDKRSLKYACSTGGYPLSRGLSADGIVGCNTWRSIQENVIGIGITSTTID